MTKFIITNVSKNETVEHMSEAGTLNELIRDLEDHGKGNAIPPETKVIQRPERIELSQSSGLPTDRESVELNVFAQKLASGK